MSRPTWTRMNTEFSLLFLSCLSLPSSLSTPPFSCPAKPLPPDFHFGIIPPLHAVGISSITSVSMDALYVLSICLSTPTTVHALHLRDPVLPASPQTIATAVIYPSHLSMFYITTWRKNTNKASDVEGSTMNLTQ